MTAIVDSVEDLTPEWFTDVLRAGDTIGPADTVTSADTRLVGTGQLGSVLATELRYGPGSPGPSSVITKLPSTDAGSRQLGVASGIYEGEVRFYQEIAPTVGIRVPRLHWSDLEPDTGRFTLVLEDLSVGSTVGDMIAGATPEQTDLAIAALVDLQTPRWDDEKLTATPWIADLARTQMLFDAVPATLELFEARFAERLSPRHMDLVRAIGPKAAGVTELIWQPPLVVCHGDYRLDNMMFGRTGSAPPITVIDWQVTRLGPPLLDIAVFMASCVDTNQRRDQQDGTLAGYHQRLLDRGLAGFSLHDVHESYRRCSLYPLLVAVAMSVTIEQTERGDAMWTRLIGGAADLVLDTAADGLVK